MTELEQIEARLRTARSVAVEDIRQWCKLKLAEELAQEDLPGPDAVVRPHVERIGGQMIDAFIDRVVAKGL